MNANDLTTIDQVRAFMSGTQRVVFEVAGGHGRTPQYAQRLDPEEAL